jgi:plastocyanin
MPLLIGAALTGCGGDDDDDDGAATAPVPAATSGDRDSSTLTVTARDFSFDVSLSSLEKGAAVEVEFNNAGSAPHTVTFYTDEDYTQPVADGDSGQVPGGGNAAFSLNVPAEGDDLYYRCEVHPSQMQGELPLE